MARVAAAETGHASCVASSCTPNASCRRYGGGQGHGAANVPVPAGIAPCVRARTTVWARLWSDGRRHPRSHGPVAWPPNRILFKLQCRQFIELVRQLAAQPPGPQADEWLARTMAVGQQLQEAYFGKLTDAQQSALEVCGRRVRRQHPCSVWLKATVAR